MIDPSKIRIMFKDTDNGYVEAVATYCITTKVLVGGRHLRDHELMKKTAEEELKRYIWHAVYGDLHKPLMELREASYLASIHDYDPIAEKIAVLSKLIQFLK